MSRGRRRELHEEHENHERWLVTYADMVTLLMVLFIVMFAMSVVDEKKFNALKSGLAAGFGQSTSVLSGSESILEQPGVSSVEPLTQDTSLVDAVRIQSDAATTGAGAGQANQQSTREADRLVRLLHRLQHALATAGLKGDIQPGYDDRGLVLSLTSRHIVFQPNLAELSPRGARVLDAIAPVLKSSGNPMRIDGHTNQVPVKPKYFASDWDLSAARAVTVLRHLSEVGGIPGSRLSAEAFGHEKPLIDPSKPGSQRVNKRVDIVVVADLSPAARQVLAAAFPHQHDPQNEKAHP
jgi:chemotaxis protein MotB